MRLIWPMIGHERVTSPYGLRVHPVTRAVGWHAGIDIAAPVGTPVRAAFPGTVTAVWEDKAFGGGLTVLLCGTVDGHAVQVGYAHLSRALVRKGDSVPAGAELALSGGQPGTYGAGMSTAPHLHVTLRIDGERVDPLGDAGAKIDWQDKKAAPAAGSEEKQ